MRGKRVKLNEIRSSRTDVKIEILPKSTNWAEVDSLKYNFKVKICNPSCFGSMEISSMWAYGNKVIPGIRVRI